MTIRISFVDNAVRVAVEIDGKIESAITELPQRKWVGLTDEEMAELWENNGWYVTMFEAVEAKLKEKNT